jgi:uncharacterized repeat protein (TIGR03803 family)
MWSNGISSSSSRTEQSCRLLFAAAAAIGILIFATAPLYSQTQPVVNYDVRLKFNGSFNGSHPTGNLILDSNGAVYGVTNIGGEEDSECKQFGPGCGVLYKWDHGRFTTVHDFTGQNPSTYFPSSGLIRDAQGNFYGETSGNGGTVYKLDTQGNITVLHTFTIQEYLPNGSLIQDAGGNLYGVTSGLCNSRCGEVFRIDPAGSETVLYNFPVDGTMGSYPSGNLVLDAEGNLYGTTTYGGTGISESCCTLGAGVLFKLTPSGQMTVLHNFNGTSDGAVPSNLVRDQQGNLYGYTWTAGDLKGCPSYGGCGTVYKYDTNGDFTVIYTFTGEADGAQPTGIPLLIGGSIYGTTGSGGVTYESCNCGVVFKLDLNGTETVLHTFSDSNGDGNAPSSGLVVDAAGNFWGATYWGGNRAVTLDSCGQPGDGCGALYTFTLTNP